MATIKGTIKKTALSEFKNIRKSGLIAMKLRQGDYLRWSRLTNTGDQIMIITKQGKSIRFNEKDISSTGRASMGVRGIRLKAEDQVVDVDIIQNPDKADLLVIMENGLGKCTKVTNYREQARGGTGVKTANVTKKTGNIVKASIIEEQTEGDLIIISKHGQAIRMPMKNIPSQGRATQGVYLMRLNGDDKVATCSVLPVIEPEDSVIETEQKKSTIKPKKEAKQESLIKS
jgi:DNA gyrase subunit A